MSDGFVNTSVFIAALIEMLRTELSFPVGDSFAPLQPNTEKRQEFPYFIVRDHDTAEFHGPAFCAPQADSCEEVTITTFGKRADQVRLLQDKLKRVLIGKTPGGGKYIVDLIVPDHTIMERSLGLKGRMRTEGTTFFTEDLYRFEVSSQV